MDPKNLALLVALVLQLAPLLIAPLASLTAMAAEKLPAFPYEGKTKAGIIAALLLAALAIRFALAWATGTLPGVDWASEWRIVYDALMAAGFAAGGYALVNSDKPALPGG